MTNVVLESPLAAWVPQAHSARSGQRSLQVDQRTCLLHELPLKDMLNLRGQASDTAFAQAVQQFSGLPLPLQTNTAESMGERQLLWLGPDEWLLKLPMGLGEPIEAALRTSLQGRHFSVVQVGSGNTTLTLQGPAAADLLARGCPLDLHRRNFPDGALAQTHIAKANVVLLCLKAEQSYEITVRRSFADYLFKWLCAAQE